jgi:hypothetical protein
MRTPIRSLYGWCSEVSHILYGIDMTRKAVRRSITYFDILAGVAALALASACLTRAIDGRPGWGWNAKDSLGLGLCLGILLAFLLLRRRVPAHRLPWLRVGIAASTVAAGGILFRHWSGMGVGVGAMLLLFALCLRSQPIAAKLMREHIARALLVVGSLLGTVLLAEGALRLVPALVPEGAWAELDWRTAAAQPWHVAHHYLGHLHNIAYLRQITTSTNAETTRPWPPARFDAWGFRNAEPWPERVDILAVGDSLTYSLTVPDAQAWSIRLERALAPRRIVNLGLIGAAPQQYLRVYETFGATLFPKVLLIGLFLGNDPTDAVAFDAWWRTARQTDFIDFLLHKGRTGGHGWLQGSYVYTALKHVRAAYHPGPALQGKTVQLADGGRVQLVPRVLTRQASVWAPGYPAFALVLQTLEHLCTLATQQQTHCLVLLFPAKEEVYLPVMGEAVANLVAPLRPELEKRGLAYLDLGPYFQQRAAVGETLFWEVDGHPNARGYAVIAEVLAAHLQKHAARYGLD